MVCGSVTLRNARRCACETTDEHWTFCFNGGPLFPIALTSAHENFRSRHGSNLIIAMQPKRVIDNLTSTPEKRSHATIMVRGLLKEYDDIEISPDLSDYGKPGTSESRQLTLLDENKSSECPYRISIHGSVAFWCLASEHEEGFELICNEGLI